MWKRFVLWGNTNFDNRFAVKTPIQILDKELFKYQKALRKANEKGVHEFYDIEEMKLRLQSYIEEIEKAIEKLNQK